jgi:hypothetical protein
MNGHGRSEIEMDIQENPAYEPSNFPLMASDVQIPESDAVYAVSAKSKGTKSSAPEGATGGSDDTTGPQIPYYSVVESAAPKDLNIDPDNEYQELGKTPRACTDDDTYDHVLVTGNDDTYDHACAQREHGTSGIIDQVYDTAN